ncbi:TLP-20 [Operophtera brumata nucleopolyhedrovirus]|uniref:TLP-20 n=1 Tax=Operophtera brumata nucleopolyhedrovirus TaxID=1046267 RepID=A0A2H4UZS6_9ABAC|nr:TLP-20 [Operophtera brumata nucleopolyhedrovirus]AUA60303.1 TLP-20 [Operophtera brumata nucleopolyhedrovirus]
MAINNTGTMDISVYVTQTIKENTTILSFSVQDEYHLKKLGVGAYPLTILETNLLKQINKFKYIIETSENNYNISLNFNSLGGINVLLFNRSPMTLKKDQCLFNIISENAENNNKMMPLANSDTNIEDESGIFDYLSSDLETDVTSIEDDDRGQLEPEPKRQKLDDIEQN